MALPTISSYALPAKADLPQPRHVWNFEPSRAALLVHDMQAYFLAPYAQNETIQTVIHNLSTLVQACRKAGIPVFYTAQKGNQERCDRGLQAEFWGPGMKAIAEHETIVQALQPQAGDYQLVKHRYSAFQRSHLADQLRVRGKDQLLIGGVYAHIGCMLTAAEAFQRDIEPFLVADALADFNREKHLLALQWGAATCATPLMSAETAEKIQATTVTRG